MLPWLQVQVVKDIQTPKGRQLTVHNQEPWTGESWTRPLLGRTANSTHVEKMCKAVSAASVWGTLAFILRAPLEHPGGMEVKWFPFLHTCKNFKYLKFQYQTKVTWLKCLHVLRCCSVATILPKSNMWDPPGYQLWPSGESTAVGFWGTVTTAVADVMEDRRAGWLNDWMLLRIPAWTQSRNGTYEQQAPKYSQNRTGFLSVPARPVCLRTQRTHFYLKLYVEIHILIFRQYKSNNKLVYSGILETEFLNFCQISTFWD